MGLFGIIKEDFSQPKIQDPVYNSCVELFFNYPGVWAVVNYRFTHFFYTKNFERTAGITSGVSQFLTGIDLHPGATLGGRILIDHASGVVIGQTAVIGGDILIYQDVTLGGTSLEEGIKCHPTIKKGVIIGSSAKVLGNITIGENTKISSNTVIAKDIGANLAAVGIPACIVEERRKNKEDTRTVDANCKDKLEELERKITELEKALSGIK